MEFVCEICDCSFPCNSKLERHYKSKSHIAYMESLSLPISTNEQQGPVESMQTDSTGSLPRDTRTHIIEDNYFDSEVRYY